MVGPILLSIVIAVASPADTIRVGHPSLQLTLPPGADTVDSYVSQEGEVRRAVTSVQTILEVPEGYLIVQENLGANGSLLTLDSILVAPGTLATLWHGDVTPAGRRHVAFGDGRVTGVAVDSLGRETSIEAELSAGSFDYSIFSLVADRLPLSVGFTATIATYDITRGPIFVSIEVLDAEDVVLGGTTYETWKMSVDLGPQSVTRWVDRTSRRELKWSVKMDAREMTGERRHG